MDPKSRDADALFALPWRQFTAGRDRLARTLKASGDAEGAEAVRALSKPSVSAWAVNQLYWHDRECHEALVSAGEALRRAQKARLSGGAASVREAMDRRDAAVAAAAGRVQALAAAGGETLSGAMHERVRTSLEALATLPPSALGPPGRLVKDLQATGLAGLASLASTPVSSRAVLRLVEPPRGPSAPARSPGGSAAARRAEARREAARARQEAALARDEASLEAIRSEIEQAAADAERLQGDRAAIDREEAGLMAEIDRLERRRRELDRSRRTAADALARADARRARLEARRVEIEQRVAAARAALAEEGLP
jgi:hypothetical protein